MNELERLKKLAEKQKQEKAKLEGKLESLYEELGEEGFSSLTDAKEQMDLLEKKIEKMKKVFNNKLSQFKKEHAHELS